MTTYTYDTTLRGTAWKCRQVSDTEGGPYSINQALMAGAQDR